ncbi:MAG: methyltransferase domain-containing protein [Chloroflexota bacterium]
MTAGIDWHARFRQQAAWTQPLRQYLYQQTGLANANRVLEVGCGTGALLADLPTRAAVHGLDLIPGRLAQARTHAPASLLTCGDALHLPFPAGAFALSLCHYLLLWVDDPLVVLKEMKRVTRPGGSVLALAEPDYSQRVDLPETLARLGRLQTESLRRQGADPALGGRLADLFQRSGLTVIESGTLSSGSQKPASTSDWELEWAVLADDLSAVLPAGDIQQLKQLDQQAWERGERVLTVPTYFAWGRA